MTSDQITLESFLERNCISQADWENSRLSWEIMTEIARDHEGNRTNLVNTAELFARTLQRSSKVHSVRYRVKDGEHLLAKLVRKASAGKEKYQNINKNNYFEIVSDLVGVRALHLFKDDCFDIDSAIRSTWKLNEDPVAYVREGDPQDLSNRFREIGLDVKSHSAGYRSVHYVCSSQPLQRKVLVEVQVRTIFEEGWSEIDHRVRYPNYSNDQLVAYFLTIFNRLAGSADEMGTFVQGLTSVLATQYSQIDIARRDKDDALAKMTSTLESLSELRKQDQAGKQEIDSLKAELSKLRRLNAASPGLISSYLDAVRASQTDDQGLQKLLGSPSARDILNSLYPSMAVEALKIANRETTVGGLLAPKKNK